MPFKENNGWYSQIADMICMRIADGEWQSEEKLPSIRETAISLQVNPNTVARSYQCLTDREIVENRRGLGYFVCSNAKAKILHEIRRRFIEDEIPQIFLLMDRIGMSMEELIQLYKTKHKPNKE